MFNFINNAFSRFLATTTNAVGKIRQFGSNVGKHVINASKFLTPQAESNANLSGLSATLAKISNSAYQSNRPDIIDNYNLDKQLSDSETAIYYNQTNVIIGFRGTANVKDIITDIDIVKGTTNDPRYRQAVDIYNKVKAKYPELNIIATGHSLGGNLALYLNSLYNIQSESFNAGLGLGFIKSNPNRDNAILHIIKGDPISSLGALSNLGKTRVYNAVTENPHSMQNYITS
jgi:hypothetical protein